MNNTLKNLGLTESEIELYLLLIKSGELSLSQITNTLSLNPSSARYLCESLASKQMATRDKRNNGAIYKAFPPEKAGTLLKLKSDQAKTEILEYNLKNKQIPHILAVSSEKEATELYKKFWNMVPKGETVYSHTQLLPPDLSKFSDDIWDTSIRIRKRRNIHLNILCEKSNLADFLVETDSNQNRTTIILPESDFEIPPFEIIACRSVMMEFAVKEEGYLALLSTSPAFAITATKRLKMLWESLQVPS